ncbi:MULTISPECIES: hypothetical protein [unclassified Caballeronia]|uniref:hypothetical protein n=1 Tax=unclassified Caballeronia TaxID=2646786 RepID=UPI002028774E|nr:MULTISPECIES: hypothetical protein [unclassified Caballeronia]
MKKLIAFTALLLSAAITNSHAASEPGSDSWNRCLQRGVQKEGYNATGAAKDADVIVHLLMTVCPDETMAWNSQCMASGRSQQNCQMEEMLTASKAIRTYGK